MKEPMEHVERARLPWQTERITECGKPVAEFAAVLSREAYLHKLREQGQQRAAMTTCMTCLTRSGYHPASWEDDPAAVMQLHCERRHWSRQPDSPIQIELRALALLVQAHRDEFDQAIRDLGSAVPLAAQRKRARGHRRD